MIHWGWLVLAFYGGVFAGFACLALCSAAGTADERITDQQTTRALHGGRHDRVGGADPDSTEVAPVELDSNMAERLRGEGDWRELDPTVVRHGSDRVHQLPVDPHAPKPGQTFVVDLEHEAINHKLDTDDVRPLGGSQCRRDHEQIIGGDDTFLHPAGAYGRGEEPVVEAGGRGDLCFDRMVNLW